MDNHIDSTGSWAAVVSVIPLQCESIQPSDDATKSLGSVYAARAPNGSDVAVKVIEINGMPEIGATLVQSYLNEVRHLQRLGTRTNYVVQIFDFDFDPRSGRGKLNTSIVLIKRFIARYSVYRHGTRRRESRQIDRTIALDVFWCRWARSFHASSYSQRDLASDGRHHWHIACQQYGAYGFETGEFSCLRSRSEDCWFRDIEESACTGVGQSYLWLCNVFFFPLVILGKEVWARLFSGRDRFDHLCTRCILPSD